MKRIRRLPFQGHKRATAGIIAGVMLFAMLFTVGSGFFVFVNSQNQLYVKSLSARTTGVQENIYESLLVTPIKQSGNIKFYANNTGSLPANITAAFVLDSSGNVLKCLGVGIPTGSSCYYSTTALSTIVNLGRGSPTIDTSYTYVSGTVTVKVLTARGNVFSSSYPLPTSPLVAAVAQSVLNVAIGNLTINFNSLQSCIPATQDCRPTSTAWTNGWELTPGTGTRYLFRIDVANAGSKDLLLESKTGLFFFRAQDGGGGTVPRDTYIMTAPNVDNSGTDGAGTYTDYSTSIPVGGAYVTLYIGADADAGSSIRSWASNNDAGIHLMTLTMFAYTDVDSSGTKNSGDTPYGQSVPFQGLAVN